MCLDNVLCFRHRRRVARDNTVMYRWRTLQLLPGMERPTYAGAVVEVLEGLDGQLAVRYQGEIVPSQEAPPRPGILRSFNGSPSHGTPMHGGLNGLGKRWESALVALDAGTCAIIYLCPKIGPRGDSTSQSNRPSSSTGFAGDRGRPANGKGYCWERCDGVTIGGPSASRTIQHP